MNQMPVQLKDGQMIKAPEIMSGPHVHLLKKQIMQSLDNKEEVIYIDFSDVAYIDLHGLVLFKDLCELIRTSGKTAFAYMLQPDMRDLLAEVDLLAENQQAEESGSYMLRTA